MVEEKKYTRVDAKISIGCKVLSKEEATHARSRIGKIGGGKPEFKLPPDHKDPILNDWLKMLNAKLDALLGTQTKDADVPPDMPVRPVNLSAGGVMFPADASCNVGDTIEIQMVLPLKKPLPLVLIGKVHKVSAPIISATFINIGEDIRQKIIDYVFLREREIMMAKRI